MDSEDFDRERRGRGRLLASVGVVAVLLLAAVGATAWSIEDGQLTLPGSDSDKPTTDTTIPNELKPFARVIKGYIACPHENDLNGDSLEDQVPAYNPDFTGNPQAIADIVLASKQLLGDAEAFFADCYPYSAKG